MDLVFEDELDYEEVELEDDPVKGDAKGPDSEFLGCDDEYLQIDCQEEKEALNFTEVSSEDGKPRTNFSEQPEDIKDPLCEGDGASGKEFNSPVMEQRKLTGSKKLVNDYDITSENTRIKGIFPPQKNENVIVESCKRKNKRNRRKQIQGNCRTHFQKSAAKHLFNNIFRESNLSIQKKNVHGAVDGRGFRKSRQLHNNYSLDVVQRNSGDDERVLLNQRRIARLKRFSDDNNKVIQNDLSCQTDKEKQIDLSYEKEYLQKVDELNQKREKILSLKEKKRGLQDRGDQNHDVGFMRKFPEINKEYLMKKKNPFNIFKSDATEKPLTSKVKEVLLKTNINEEDYFNTTSTLDKVQPQQMEERQNQAHVKFVRTISKTYDELGLSRSACQTLKDSGEDRSRYSFVGAVSVVEPVRKTIPDGVFLNQEMKLNFPKENSAVIRFTDPASAENFFGLYHGQKVHNYFLNVIVI